MIDYLKAADINRVDAETSIEKWNLDDIYVNASCQRLSDGIECCLRYVVLVSNMKEKTRW